MARPVLGFLCFSGGSIAGALVKDLKLANELHSRGYEVVVYWMFSRVPGFLDVRIRQRIVSLGMPGAAAGAGASGTVEEFMERFAIMVSGDPENDPELVSRLVRYMQKDGVTHLLPSFACLCPIALAAQARGAHEFDYLVTFQGDEVFANYAERAGCLTEYYRRIQEVVARSRWPAIVISRDYAQRIRKEMGVDPSRMHLIYPGTDPAHEPAPPFATLADHFP
jgi:hypothetical protein